MIIDRILDRKDNEELFENYNYNAHDFYFEVLGYGKIGNEIALAMDYGTNEDVQNALCKYSDENDYNPQIKNYVNAREWL